MKWCECRTNEPYTSSCYPQKVARKITPRDDSAAVSDFKVGGEGVLRGINYLSSGYTSVWTRWTRHVMPVVKFAVNLQTLKSLSAPFQHDNWSWSERRSLDVTVVNKLFKQFNLNYVYTRIPVLTIDRIIYWNYRMFNHLTGSRNWISTSNLLFYQKSLFTKVSYIEMLCQWEPDQVVCIQKSLSVGIYWNVDWKCGC